MRILCRNKIDSSSRFNVYFKLKGLYSYQFSNNNFLIDSLAELKSTLVALFNLCTSQEFIAILSFNYTIRQL